MLSRVACTCLKSVFASCTSFFALSTSEIVARQRWRLLGHVLRLKKDVPANIAAARFFAAPEAPRFLGRTKIALPIVLHRDLQSLTPPQSLASLEDLNKLRSFAADRDAWKESTELVIMGLTRGHKRPRATIEEQDAPPRRRLRSHGPASE